MNQQQFRAVRHAALAAKHGHASGGDATRPAKKAAAKKAPAKKKAAAKK